MRAQRQTVFRLLRLSVRRRRDATNSTPREARISEAHRDGRVVLERNWRVTDFSGDGRISLNEIRFTRSTERLMSFTSSLAANLPIVASIGGFSTSTTTPPRIVVTDTDLFAGPPTVGSSFRSI
jgi:hypothetical protein